MKTIIIAMVTFLAAALLPAGDKQVHVTAKLNTPVISVRGGTVFVQVTVRVPRLHIPRRDPLNLTVVLDRSGSMGEERKMAYAKKALHHLIDQLQKNDRFSLVIYDDVIEVVQYPTRAADKRRLHSLVDEIQPRGATNLGGGLEQGLRIAESYRRKGLTNRVVILSDGLANRGVTDPWQLNAMVQRYRRHAVSVTAMGVGLDYNENLMVGLAESGGGNYYFIESPSSLASIMRREFDAVSSIACRNAVLDFRLGDGVVVRDVIGYQWERTGSGGTVHLGDLYQEDERDITLELSAPAGDRGFDVFSGNITFDGSLVKRQASAAVASLAYTEDVKVVEERRDMDVQAKSDVAVSTRKVEKALEALDAGREEEAAKVLNEAKSFLSSSPAAASGAGGEGIRQQMDRLDAFKDSIGTSDARRAKKAIQYENYLLQKNKHQ